MTDTGGVLVGYNAGDNIRYLEVNGSLTERIAFIDEIPGNTGEIGKWIFRLNQEFVNIGQYSSVVIENRCLYVCMWIIVSLRGALYIQPKFSV